MTVDAEFAVDVHHVHGATFLTDAGANAEEMRRFCHIVGTATCPHEDVIGQVTDDVVRFVFRRGERSREVGDVFVVPRIPIRDGGAVGDAGDLVTVIPPGHDASVFRRVVSHPLVRVHVIANENDAAVLELAFEHYGRHGHALRHLVGVVHKCRPHDGKVRESETQERQTKQDGNVRVVDLRDGLSRVTDERIFILRI